MAAEGCGRLRMGAECRELVLLFDDASHETLLFACLTTTPRPPMEAEGRPTLVLFFVDASHETNILIDFQLKMNQNE